MTSKTAYFLDFAARFRSLSKASGDSSALSSSAFALKAADCSAGVMRLDFALAFAIGSYL